MSKLILRFSKDESAATSIEYALIAGMLSIVIIGIVNTIGSNLNTLFFGPISAGLK
jgi:pilus assembly protein Flp/PilA